MKNEERSFSAGARLLVGGDAAFSEIVSQIEQARHSIEINIFIWRNDKTGRLIAQKLLEAADDNTRPDLKIKIVKDSTGSAFEHAEHERQSFFHPELNLAERFKAFFVWLAYAEEDTARSGRQRPSRQAVRIAAHPSIDFIQEKRNDHSKFFLFDDRVLITGGMNIGDEYRRWHDYMVMFDDAGLVRMFRECWEGGDSAAAQTPERIGVRFFLNSWRPGFRELERRQIKPEILRLIGFAQHQHLPLTIEMSYLGDRDVTEAIIDAVNAGIKVNIVLPEKANVQEDLNRKVVRQILRGVRTSAANSFEVPQNLRVFCFSGMLHAKLIHVGELDPAGAAVGVTFFGSSNINCKSLLKLAELNIRIDDPECGFTRDVKRQLLRDMGDPQRSRLCGAADLRARRSYSRLVAFIENVV